MDFLFLAHQQTRLKAAQECFELAQRCARPDEREQYLKLAHQWHQMAEQLEFHVKRQKHARWKKFEGTH